MMMMMMLRSELAPTQADSTRWGCKKQCKARRRRERECERSLKRWATGERVYLSFPALRASHLAASCTRYPFSAWPSPTSAQNYSSQSSPCWDRRFGNGAARPIPSAPGHAPPRRPNNTPRDNISTGSCITHEISGGCSRTCRPASSTDN